MTSVQKALNLGANVHSQGLSPLDLMWSQCCPCVIELLQAILNIEHGKISQLDSYRTESVDFILHPIH